MEDPTMMLASTRGVDLLGSLEDLYECCARQGLLEGREKETEKKDKLRAIFDVAVDRGIGSLVVNYAIDVCMNVHRVSADAEEAYLMDGEMLAEWTFERLEREGVGGMQEARRKGTVCTWLDSILRALGAGEKEMSRSWKEDGREKRHQLLDRMGLARSRIEDLLMYYKVLVWCGAKGLGRADPCGRFGSYEEWKESVKQRRAKKMEQGDVSLFLDDLLGEDASRDVYPPKGVEEAARYAFLDRSSMDPEHRMAFWLYYLFDLGCFGSTKLDFSVAFSTRMEVVQEAHAAFLLDDERESSLAEAWHVLAMSAHENVSFKIIQSLASQGMHDEAFQLLMIRGIDEDFIGTGTDSSLTESLVTVSVYLECDLLPKALFVARRLWSCVADPSKRSQFASTILRFICEHCKARFLLDDFVKLPFNEEEEAVICRFFEEHAGQKEGEFLIIFYMMRSRYTEAIAAGQRLPELTGAGWQQEAMMFRQTLLRSAATFLTDTQMNMEFTQAYEHSESDAPILELCTKKCTPTKSGSHHTEKLSAFLNSSVGLECTLKSRAFGGEDPPFLRPPIPQDTDTSTRQASTIPRTPRATPTAGLERGIPYIQSSTRQAARAGTANTPFKMLAAKRATHGLFRSSPVMERMSAKGGSMEG